MITTTWVLDSTFTRARFAVRHFGVQTVMGEFSGLTGALVYDPENPANAQVKVVAPVESVNTGLRLRDMYLLFSLFKNTDYPEMVFKSKQVELTRPNRGQVHGDLTIRGVTRPITLETKLIEATTGPNGLARLRFVAKSSFDRAIFGLYMRGIVETGRVVGREISITLEAEFVPAREAVHA